MHRNPPARASTGADLHFDERQSRRAFAIAVNRMESSRAREQMQIEKRRCATLETEAAATHTHTKNAQSAQPPARLHALVSK
jgi:hypothetical protein